ncbi:MAG: Uncharacterized protein AWU57_185 [Marinobacter sp. T13-3]|nr:MAG: Uncharacterized protein AWU57_185 [Marinobacter sp. T13-3]
MFKPIFKGAIERPVTILDESANLTPSLGFTLYGDRDRERRAVLEITRLDVGKGRSVVNSFDEDRTLATWGLEEQEDFFAEAFRRGVRGRFGAERLAQQASVLSATNLLLAGMSQTIAENGQGIVDGRSTFGSREIGAEWFGEVLSLGYNKTASFINDSFNGVTHGSLQTGLEGVADALSSFQKHNKDRPADRFYMISHLLQSATKDLLDNVRDHQAFMNLWAKEAQELQDIWDYHRSSMTDPEILVVEPTWKVISGEIPANRDRHDFSGSFPVIGHWYNEDNHKTHLFEHPSHARKHGFDFGPPSYRQYQAIMDNMKHRGGLIAPRLADNDKGFMGGTPVDLPPELAQKRLDALLRFDREDKYVHSAIELREIITSAKLSKPVDFTRFQPQSLQRRAREHFTQTDSLAGVEKQIRAYDRRANDASQTPTARAVAAIRRKEMEHLRDNHRHALTQAERTDALTETQAELAAAFAGADWGAAMARFEQEINQEISMRNEPEITEAPINTRLELAYRSGSLKGHETVILPGAITAEQIQQISNGCFDGSQIIANQVHLPTPLETALEENQIDIAEDDHVLTDLADWDDGEPKPEDLHTTEEPTHGMDIGTLAQTIENIGPNGWNFINEEERLGLPDAAPGDSLSL